MGRVKLQAIVWNKKTMFGKENNDLPDKKAMFGKESNDLPTEKAMFGKENNDLPDEKVDVAYKNLLVKIVEEAVKSRALTPITSENIKKVIENFQFRQIFGRKEIKDELGYGDSKAGKTIELMQSLDIIEPVEGKGKGKYILKKLESL